LNFMLVPLLNLSVSVKVPVCGASWPWAALDRLVRNKIPANTWT